MGNQNKKGYSVENALSNFGKELTSALNQVMADVPQEYLIDLEKIENDENFELQRYIYSIIAEPDTWMSEFNMDEFEKVQKILRDMQSFLKSKMTETEEKMK